MKRFLVIVIAGMAAAAHPALAQAPRAGADGRYIAAFQNPDGGFAGNVGGKSSLGPPRRRSGRSATRRVDPGRPGPHRLRRVLLRQGEGRVRPTPGGKADVSTTAAGLMAVVP